MLTLEEILCDVASSPGFEGVHVIGVNTRGSSGLTPLYWIAVLSDFIGAKMLIGAGAEVNAVNDEGNTPLHEADVFRQAWVVKLLVEDGASTELKSRLSVSAIDWAVAVGSGPIIGALKDAP